MKGIRNIIVFTLLTATLMLFYNQTANWHFHRLPNGALVEHAHPYSKTNTDNSPFQKHSHTEFELLVFGLLSTTATFVVILILSLILHESKYRKVRVRLVPFIPSFYFLPLNPLRGPPSC